MNSYKTFWMGMAMVFIACFMALPLSNAQTSAQTRIFSNVLPSESSGAYLGIQMDDVDAGNMSKYRLANEKGVIVRSVVKGSPAETAGIKEEDVVLEFGGMQVWSSLHLSRLVRETPVGRKVDLLISRDGKSVRLSAKLERRDSGNAFDRGDMAPEGQFGPGQRSFQFRWPEGFGSGADRGSSPANRPRLGVTVQPLTGQLAEHFGVPGKKGVLVSEVMDGSPSAGKLKSGDVITAIDGKEFDTPEEMTRLIRNKSEGSTTLKVIRDKKEITVVVNLPTGDEKGYKL